MKRMIRFLLFTLAGITGSRLCAGMESLVPNGDFEAGGEWAAPWSRPRGASIVEEADNRFLRLDGGSISVAQRIPIDPDWWKLRLTLRMRVTDVVTGDDAWKNARLAMSFHAEDGTRAGDWPLVFNEEGTSEWMDLEREYIVPQGAVSLAISAANFGVSGRAEFDDIRIVVTGARADEMANAALPDGFPGDPWDPAAAELKETATQGRLCINGLWRFRPFLESDAADRVPADVDRWGWLKVPGIWHARHWTLPEISAQEMLLPAFDPRQFDPRTLDQAWYRRRVRIPTDWAGRRVRLVFTMLQTHAAVFVD